MSDDHHDEAEHEGIHPDTSLSFRAKRAIAIHELLVEKGVVADGEIEEQVNRVSSRSPSDGAKVVARTWVDPEFKSRLLADARSAVGELGNTGDVHHLGVCTLCSCYPTALLGPPPDWYKSFSYRKRAVVEPRAVMSEFGLDVSDDIQVRVVDSTADLRYLVIPRRPEGTEDMTEDELVALVTRDSMIGVSEPLRPKTAV